MAYTYTANIKLTKPGYDNSADIAVINSNMDKIDAAYKTVDAVKLGGKPPEAYTAVNLLDNSNFANPINQRGETSYGGTWVKCIDRWICTTDEGKKVWVSAGYLSVPDKGEIVQPVSVKTANVVGKTYTFAFCITNGRIYACSGTIQDQGDIEYISQIFASVSGYQLEVYTVNNSEYLYARTRNNSGYSASIKWVALYEGEYTAETLPPYVPKPYMVELAECQRYYENSWFNKGKSGQRQFMANCISYAQADCVIPFRVPKRVAPTITFHPEGNYTEWQIYNGDYFGVGNVTAQYRDGINAFLARITKGDADTSTWTAGLGIAARGHWEASAEL